MIEPEIIKLFNEIGAESPTEIIFNENVRVKADSQDSKKSVNYLIRKTETDSCTIYHVNIKNWKTGGFINKLLIPDPDTPKEDIERAKNEFEELIDEDKAHTFIRNETAALEAEKIWNEASEIGLPSYLATKRIKSLYGCRTKGDQLIIPVRDERGKLWSIQTIYKHGSSYKKIFLPGSTYSGCYFQFGEITDIIDAIFIAEGFATAASLYDLQGRPVLCSFSAHNLKHVAKSVRSRYPNIAVVIAADVDPVGLDYGKKAARAVSGTLLPPPIPNPHPDYKDWNDYITENGKDLALMKVLEFQEKKAELTKQEWIKDWLKNKRVEVKYSNRITIFGEEQTSFDDLYDRLYCDQETDHRKISQPLLKSTLNLYIKERWKEEFERLKAPLFKPNPIPKDIDDPCMQFVKALTGEENPVHYAAIEHFIWQVKRKIKGLPIENHMMLIFHGSEQGKGKSVAMKKLIFTPAIDGDISHPTRDLFKPGDLSLCTDKRDWDALERYYVIYMDEMARMDPKQVNEIKRIITEDELNYRSPHARSTKCVRNAATLIGTTNDDPEDILVDTTGNRRFYVIYTKDVDWDLINSCNYEGMWQNVDEKKKSPIKPFLKEIRSHQKTYQRKSAVEQWLDEVGAKNTKGYAYSLNNDIWPAFKDWLEDSHTTRLSFTRDKLGRELTRLGYNRMRKSGGSRDRGFEIQIDGIECLAYGTEI